MIELLMSENNRLQGLIHEVQRKNSHLVQENIRLTKQEKKERLTNSLVQKKLLHAE